MISFEQLIPENGHVIGEIACGHEGDIHKLEQLIDCVAESGTKLIKLQIFYLEERALEGENAWDIFRKLTLNEKQWQQAVEYARSKQLMIIADVYGEKSLSLAKKLSVDGFKIHSEDLLNSYFIAQVAEEGQLLFISVGGAHRSEIYNLLNFLNKKELIRQIVLMTGIQTFPTPLGAHSLEEVSDLINKYSQYGVKVGFSDHISGDQEEAHIIPLMALAKGACVIEKHVTINRKDKWTDYHSSLSKKDFNKFVKYVKRLSSLLGPIGPMNEDEKKYRKMFKKSPVFSKDFTKGYTLKPYDIEFKKNTLHAIPIASSSLEGKQLKQDIKKGELCNINKFKNKVGGIIVARCTSNRLPNKALLKIQGRETIALVIDRMKRCQNLDCLILATSLDSSDDPLVDIAEREGILSFRGSLENVALRFYETSKHYRLTQFARITGDALLCDEVMLDKAIESHLQNGSDVTFMKNMPFGTNKEVINTQTIKTILDKVIIPSNTEYLEYFLENDRYFSVNYVASDYEFTPNYRITLDFEEDFQFFEHIYTHFNKIKPVFTLKDALAWLKENPAVANINMHKQQKFEAKDINVTLNI